MTLSQGRKTVAIPGPSIIPDRVLAAMQRPSPNIYAGELVDIAESLYPDLKAVARTRGHAAIYISNGHGAWEAAVANLLSPGDRVIVINAGFFGTRWGEIMTAMGAEVERIDSGMEGSVDPERLRASLRRNRGPHIKAVFATQTDTASSARNDIAGYRRVLDEEGHDALLAVDCIASLGCEPHEMDGWNVDVMVAASQKGLMTPAGLSFVFFNDRARTARNQVQNVPRYWDWIPRTEPEHFYELFGGTAPTHHLFALREALDMLVHEEGIIHAWERHECLAKSIWAAVDHWSEGSDIGLNITRESSRSHAVTAIKTGGTAASEDTNSSGRDADRIRDWCEREMGVTLGIGLGFSPDRTGSIFRIGHMGHLNPPMVLGTLGSVDAALKALGIPHGKGALDAAAEIIANHDHAH